MYIGNMLLLVLNLPLIPLWVKVLKIPPVLLNVLILLFCIIGVYSINRDMPDVYVLMIFGAVGFLGKKLGYEGAPLILAFILGQRIEIALRQSLIMSDGSFSIFLTRPLSAVFIVITLAITISAIIGTVRAKIKVIESDEDF
jgi:putative tricarboxylic transport membrane protein